jgi:enamine deaminase RidA (YjgF/YER057c/UK114 family)
MPVVLSNVPGRAEPQGFMHIGVVAGALDSVGATFDDIAKITLYVVDWEPSKIEAINAGAGAAAGKLGVVPVKPATLIGVDALFDPEHLIEIDATAVLA